MLTCFGFFLAFALVAHFAYGLSRLILLFGNDWPMRHPNRVRQRWRHRLRRKGRLIWYRTILPTGLLILGLLAFGRLLFVLSAHGLMWW
ncbi:hypothetical protein [Spirosoma fluminis]